MLLLSGADAACERLALPDRWSIREVAHEEVNSVVASFAVDMVNLKPWMPLL